jgi:hypothetical protein
VPVTDLTPVTDDDTTGTVVHFAPDTNFVAGLPPNSDPAWRLIEEFRPHLLVELTRAR